MPVRDYRHRNARRKNIPPAGLAAQGEIRERPKIQYAYNPHLPPVLRFDQGGRPDKLPELLEISRKRPLTSDEAALLANALRIHEPWLEWSGKREKKSFEVDPVALHIHERISAQAILRVIAREDVQRSLFADPQLEYQKAVQFYQHDVDWSNRMILGDSLQVMASLTRREDLAGKVHMIYMDPPYGIKFASNFQPEIGKRDVKDRESDLTREPEMIKAYRDTWTLGIHSYLDYLRDRLWLCKDLLHDSGSIFVQIGNENLHRMRLLLDEIFTPSNFVSQINYRSMTPLSQSGMATVYDYVLWYTKDRSKMKFSPLFEEIKIEDDNEYIYVAAPVGCAHKLLDEEKRNWPDKKEIFKRSVLTSSGYTPSCTFDFTFQGKNYRPLSGKSWRTNSQGMERLIKAERLFLLGRNPYLRQCHGDFGNQHLENSWHDTAAGYSETKLYVVETNPKIIQRCMLMTTGPGDLVLDPTCGGGTTAFVAEQWGRRWITIDTSRVALALARQRILTASFPFYKVRNAETASNGSNEGTNPERGFIYKTVPHITLKSIAQNVALDPIFARHQPILDEKLKALNAELKKVKLDLRQKLLAKLARKEKQEGKKSITDADRRRWQLPRDEWKEWEVPFDADEDWHDGLKTALKEYRAAWRAKMDEQNACIAAHAEQEELVDQPEIVRGVARVSGPFTMEAVMPAEETLSEESPIDGEPEELETFEKSATGEVTGEPANAEAYLDKMLRLLRMDGVRFPNNKVLKFDRLEPIRSEYLHGEGEWTAEDGKTRKVAVSFGPQFGPVTAYQVENALPLASRRGFDDLVFAGFSFDAAAQAVIQDDPNPRVRCHLAHIQPDVNMGDLLKETPNSQLFTVFGSPRTELKTASDGMFIIEVQGVDIYNPVDNTILPTNADKVAAWFLDTDYDGRTFCITQAFFPDKSAWDKLARSLKGLIDEEGFSALSETVSLPFPVGKHRRVAVKVIDPRGNEVMQVHRLPGKKGAAYERA